MKPYCPAFLKRPCRSFDNLGRPGSYYEAIGVKLGDDNGGTFKTMNPEKWAVQRPRDRRAAGCLCALVCVFTANLVPFAKYALEGRVRCLVPPRSVPCLPPTHIPVRTRLPRRPTQPHGAHTPARAPPRCAWPHPALPCDSPLRPPSPVLHARNSSSERTAARLRAAAGCGVWAAWA